MSKRSHAVWLASLDPWPYRDPMTEPPRPPGDGYSGGPSDSYPPPQPPGSYSAPGEAPAPGYNPPPPAGGYPPPPPGGYAQPGGYNPGPVGPPPPGYASSEDKTWALVAHFGGAAGMFIFGGVGGFIAPLIAYLVQGQKSPVARAHAIAALNFQILWSAIGFIGWATACIAIGFIIWPIALLVGIIFGIIAGIKANEGQLYKYPMSLSIIK
jgi:uncharacterized Tic20 family protein